MLIANFNLSSVQIHVLLAFRTEKDTRATNRHPFLDVDHDVRTMRRLCAEGFLAWHEGEGPNGRPPGYSITPKGEMFLRIIEEELRTTLAWFDGQEQPKSDVNGAQHDVAIGKGEINPRTGVYRKKKAPA